MSSIECFPCNAASFSQIYQVFILEYRHSLVSKILEMLIWLSTLCIVWLLHLVRHISLALEAVRKGPHCSLVKAIIFGSVLLFFVR